MVSEDGSLVRKFRSLGFVSIFTLEAMAILCAVKEIERVEGERFTIFSDSKSVIVALANVRLSGRTSFLILEIKHCTANLLKVGKRVKFIWIPIHCGIVGNERADAAAKEAICSGTDSPFNISSRDLRIKWNTNLISALIGARILALIELHGIWIIVLQVLGGHGSMVLIFQGSQWSLFVD